MKTRSLVLILLALIFIFAPQSPRTASAKGGAENTYFAQLVWPAAGSVVKPGQVVHVEWRANYPRVALNMCETELMISLDGGNTYTYISSQRNPKIQYFDWTVPEVGGAAVWAILDIRFGCLGIYPETTSRQTQSAFLISPK